MSLSISTYNDDLARIASTRYTLRDLVGALRFIRKQLQLCLSDHPSCRQDIFGQEIKCSPSQPLPCRRILDVGSIAEPTLRLREDILSFAGCPYAVLSHCWGGERLAVLTSSNLDAYKISIDFDTLPRTFQDAIIVARGVGIRLLWIDSLCIVQGETHHAEWIQECDKMGLIYENSLLHISATNSSRMSAGFLHHNLQLLHSEWLKNDAAGIAWFYLVAKSTLNTRGWVIQERALARRTVHFASDQLYWECPTAALSPIKEVHSLKANGPNVGRKRAPTPSRDDTFKWWWTTLYEYSNCFLSVSSDKTAAVSGLGQRVAAHTGYAFHYGHFFPKPGIRLSLDFYATGLMWEGFKGRQSVAQAPSWSRLSIDGCVDLKVRVSDVWNEAADLESLVHHDDAHPSMSMSLVLSGLLKKVSCDDLKQDRPGSLWDWRHSVDERIRGTWDPFRFDMREGLHRNVHMAVLYHCFRGPSTMYAWALLLDEFEVHGSLRTFKRVGIAEVPMDFAILGSDFATYELY